MFSCYLNELWLLQFYGMLCVHSSHLHRNKSVTMHPPYLTVCRIPLSTFCIQARSMPSEVRRVQPRAELGLVLGESCIKPGLPPLAFHRLGTIVSEAAEWHLRTHAGMRAC